MTKNMINYIKIVIIKNSVKVRITQCSLKKSRTAGDFENLVDPA